MVGISCLRRVKQWRQTRDARLSYPCASKVDASSSNCHFRKNERRPDDLSLLRRGLRRRCRPTGSLRGDRDHPANFGRLCSKGAALAETLDDPGRLLRPQIHGRDANWDTRSISDRRAVSGRPSSSTDRTPSRSMFPDNFSTEDYYVANKLMKGFIGSGNIDTNSRLCMASSVAGHVRAFGEDVVPGSYEDLGTGRSRRTGRQQHRLVPSGAVSATDGGARRRAARRSSSSIRAARRRARPPICICRWRSGTDVALFAACWCIWRMPAHSIATGSASIRPASTPRLRPRGSLRRHGRASRRDHGTRRRGLSRPSTHCSPAQSGW